MILAGMTSTGVFEGMSDAIPLWGESHPIEET
jgi:hypothetical protein